MNPAKQAPPRIPGQVPKTVRSLRKSEQAHLPALPTEPAADSKLPVHRHSDKELNEIRRREALAMMAPGGQSQTALPRTPR